MHSEANRLTKLMLGSFALGIDLWQKSRPNKHKNAIKQDHLHMHLLPSNPEESTYSNGIEWGNTGQWSMLDTTEAETQLLLTILRDN